MNERELFHLTADWHAMRISGSSRRNRSAESILAAAREAVPA